MKSKMNFYDTYLYCMSFAECAKHSRQPFEEFCEKHLGISKKTFCVIVHPSSHD